MDKRITLQQLSDLVAERSGMKRRKAETFVRAFFEITEEALLADGIVKAKGFGTTKIINVNDRESVNISTGQRFQIEGHAKVSFVPDSNFRDLINRPFAHFTTTILADDVKDTDLDALTEEFPITLPVTETSPAEDLGENPLYDDTPVAYDDSEEEYAVNEGNSEPITEEDVDREGDEENQVIEEGPSEEASAVMGNNHVDPEGEIPTEEAHVKEHAVISEGETNYSNGEEDMQPIIINNTIPDVTPANRWRTAFWILSTIVLMVLSYFAGYYQWFCPCEVEKAMTSSVEATSPTDATATLAHPDQPTRETSDKSQATAVSIDETSEMVVDQDQNSERTDEAKVTQERKEQDEAEIIHKAAANYEQLGGEYLITGILELHEIRTGDNLYKIARRAYGEKELARYIIFHNHITNPDLVQLGSKIEIPRLTRKP